MFDLNRTLQSIQVKADGERRFSNACDSLNTNDEVLKSSFELRKKQTFLGFGS